MTSRREFVLKIVPLAGAATALSQLAVADEVPLLTETDPMALALGFKLDTSKADQAKYPKHDAEQFCQRCIHFTTPTADLARCDLFNKRVPKHGWCSGFSKRPA